ncbi:tetraspanin-13-like [Sinocyclocheilus rhinocerous]|uniref:Tetraspanin-13-like n=1 Tax=Sinocyclocheilus rhinocerous TaxID=307959 RepID=A0A673NFL6_9TELE|nr:PREDICTED: tetraspanin-13-like [Sinocyclocheilus rhinocerous]
MACGGFVCSKTSLCILNLIYVMVSLLMIGVAAWGKWFGLVSSFRVMAAVIAVGLFLFVVAIVGLCGAVKHHQVLLFFYMLILFMVFMVQFSVSCACLAINKEQQNLLLEIGWNKSESMQEDLERSLDCCDFLEVNYNESCVATCFKDQTCRPCSVIIQAYADDALQFVGGVSLFFSFTEILGVWLAHRYRNQKDHRQNPGAFI